MIVVMIVVVHGMFKYKLRWGLRNGLRCCVANMSAMVWRLRYRLSKRWEVVIGATEGYCLHGSSSYRCRQMICTTKWMWYVKVNMQK